MGSGNILRPSRKRKGPTKAQKAARAANLRAYKENLDPTKSAAASSSAPVLVPPKPVVPPKDWKHEYEKLQRKYRHSKSRQKKLEAELSSFKLADADIRRTADRSSLRVKELSTLLEKLVAENQKKSSASKDTIEILRRQIKALKQRVRRSIRTLSRAVDRAKKTSSFRRLTKRGIFTAQARQLARVMADSGCARGKIGPLMEQVGHIFGIKVDRTMSRRTVGRAIEEGGVAAKIQAIFELSQSQGVTISADSTSNRGINIESSHMNLRVPDYASGSSSIDTNSMPKVRFLGVEKTIDHSSAESVRGWNHRLEEMIDLFNRSPLGQRLKRHYSVRQFLRILKGMHGDHAASEQSTAKGLKQLKHEAAIQDLGEQALAGKAYMELVDYLGAWNARKILEAGGKEGWDALSPAEQVARDKKMMDDIVTVLGREAYNSLNAADRRTLDLFIWAGCCMHKDLNSFRGGNNEMMLEWKRLGVLGPILLANKENAALLQHLLDPAHPKDATLTEDQLRAFEASTRGGVKAAALAGAIFNNKDDKKGQADRHVDFYESRTRKAASQISGHE
ncbi:hypothetical protein MSAN_01589300 [Mycena sanguinolenta]|uniref:Uncharacterized protein n=1 Tax=Mycena sanguinolenta TaxID=230812 RepID=A0A8H7CY14_9AGAR|nr:hypothetical protein MSAN_01589300 [Mycena sanguinolenta]